MQSNRGVRLRSIPLWSPDKRGLITARAEDRFGSSLPLPGPWLECPVFPKAATRYGTGKRLGFAIGGRWP